MTAPEWIPICDAASLLDGGKGIRFSVRAGAEVTSAFVVRFKGVAHGYLNRCAHVPIELDWAEGEFFESSGLYLMCSTHGAIYAPESGRCEGGPCRGGKLRKIAVCETGNQVFWLPDDFITPAPAPESTAPKDPK